MAERIGEDRVAVIDQFLGRRVSIPEDRRYDPEQGLWLKQDDGGILCGLGEPALVLAGGLNDLEFLCPDGQTVVRNDTVIFAITGKIMYVGAPLAGRVYFNRKAGLTPALVGQSPYDDGWLFRIESEEITFSAVKAFADAETYLNCLKGSEGFKNPRGLKGGVSGMCKAVYSGIREQSRGR